LATKLTTPSGTMPEGDDGSVNGVLVAAALVLLGLLGLGIFLALRPRTD
jgi:hypothetical protein